MNSLTATHPTNPSRQQNGLTLERARFMHLIRLALSFPFESSPQEHEFAIHAILLWLSQFPGDLDASLLYAQALAKSGQLAQAQVVLDGLCAADPEFVAAWQLRYQLLEPAKNQRPVDQRQASLYALAVLQTPEVLQGAAAYPGAAPAWVQQLHQARTLLAQGEIQQAEGVLVQVLAQDPPTPLLGLTHMAMLSATQAPLPSRLALARHYRQRWPDCLAMSYWQAHGMLESGASEAAIDLIHQCAARDVAAQVCRRIWPAENPYASLWPASLALELPLQLPPRLVAAMGWNRLSSGALPPPAQPVQASSPAAQALPKTTQLPSHRQKLAKHLSSIQQELDTLASGLQIGKISQIDGRFPVYVLLSSRSMLTRKYGEQGFYEIAGAMTELAQAVQAHRNWHARVFLADDAFSTSPCRVQPAKAGDAWAHKLALADLDKALARQGEMIGALLIVGGPDIIPFHHLPNPVDDLDADVPSDNPYATRDENYFIPEWPVGRLVDAQTAPSETPGPQALLRSLRAVTAEHQRLNTQRSWRPRLAQRIEVYLRDRINGFQPSYGCSAEAWRAASSMVYQPLGAAKDLVVSPPLDQAAAGAEQASQLKRRTRQRLPRGRMAYFNLHGLADAANWYGQRDAASQHAGPDYPVALRPQDIRISKGGRATPPRLVFSEACYGAHIIGKSEESSLALKFLEAGTRVFVGSTVMAYGSLGTPLIAADFLGRAFWSFVRRGLPAGEALRQARLQLASEMQRRQGYLDGEDQKTLISFVLYGDPLAQPREAAVLAKSPRRLSDQLPVVKTICDRSLEQQPAEHLSVEAIHQARHLAAKYLPGMEDALVQITSERSECCEPGHVCPTNQLHGKFKPAEPPRRKLVTLSKQIARTNQLHTMVARLTFDESGDLLKLVVSR